VFSGQVVAEYDGSGARRNSYVLAGGERVARQGGGLFWRHANPVTGDVVETDSQGAVSGKETLDPAGTNVGDSDPLAAQQGRGNEGGMSQAQMDKMYAQLLPPSLGGDALQVNVDGFQMSAYTAFNLISIGAARVSTISQSVMPIYSRSRQSYVGLAIYNAQAAANGVAFLGEGSLGYLPVGSSYTQGVGIQFQSWFGSLYNSRPDAFGREGIDRNFLSERAAQVIGLVFIGHAAPQNPTQLTSTEVNKLGSNLQKLLDDSECGKYIKAMLDNLPADIGGTTRSSGSLMDTFNRIKNGGGFWSKDTGPIVAAMTNPATLTMTFNSQRTTPSISSDLGWQRLGATLTLVHELTHVFTSEPKLSGYGHLEMARAASAAASSLGINVKATLGLDLPTVQVWDDKTDKAFSAYYDRVLAYACRKVKL
jgi:hypothetical protein